MKGWKVWLKWDTSMCSCSVGHAWIFSHARRTIALCSLLMSRNWIIRQSDIFSPTTKTSLSCVWHLVDNPGVFCCRTFGLMYKCHSWDNKDHCCVVVGGTPGNEATDIHVHWNKPCFFFIRYQMSCHFCCTKHCRLSEPVIVASQQIGVFGSFPLPGVTWHTND